MYFLASVSAFGKEAFTDLARWRLHSAPDRVEWLTSGQFIFQFRPSNVSNLISLVRMNPSSGDNTVAILDLDTRIVTDLATHKQRAVSPYLWQSGDRIFALDAGRVYRLMDSRWVPVENTPSAEECQNLKYEQVHTGENMSLLFLCVRKNGFVRLYDLNTGQAQSFLLPPASEPYDISSHPHLPIVAFAVSGVWKTTEPVHRILIYELKEDEWTLRTFISTGRHLVRFVGWAGERLFWQELSLADPDYSGEGSYLLTSDTASRSKTNRLVIAVSESAFFTVPAARKYFVRKSGKQLWAESLDSSRERVLLLERGQVRHADVSPDGRWIAVEVRQDPSIPYADLWVVENPFWESEVPSQ